MIFRYKDLDQEFREQVNLARLTKVFLELLTRAAGDADQALDYMERLWKRQNMDKLTGLSFKEFKAHLEESGLLEFDEGTGRANATSAAERQIQQAAFDDIFRDLHKGTLGEHPSNRPGLGGEKLPETRPFEFGDMLQDVDFPASVGRAVLRTGLDHFELSEDDLETHQREHLTSTSTVILIDISHSMTLYGEDRITPAKKVAMALVEFIQRRYPRDTIDVVLFGDYAEEVPVQKIVRVTNGPFHTNTKAGLEMAQRILMRKRSINKQVFMVTDGKPSAITEHGELYKNPYGLDPKIVAQTINAAIQLRRHAISLTTFMITTDPQLQDFVDKMTRANHGRAYYATLDSLGSFIFADYARNKKKRV